MSSAKAIIVGRLGRDPEVRDTSKGKVTEIAVATDQRGDKPTLWWRVACWGKLGDVVAQHLAKGREVVVMGTIGLDEWTGKDGTKRTTLTCDASSVDFVGGKGEQQSRPQEPRPQTGGSDWAARGEARDTGQSWAQAERVKGGQAPSQQRTPPAQGDLGNPYNDDDVPF